jgi:hypothetical protein
MLKYVGKIDSSPFVNWRGDAELVEHKGNRFSGNFHWNSTKIAKSIEDGK